jgi:predicted dehydrogenase
MPNIALLGGSHIHTPNFARTLANNAPAVTTLFVWDPDADTARRRQEVTGGEVVEDYKPILKDKRVDAVVICSQTDLHEELVLAAAKAKKHMFVEKPLGMVSKDAFRMAKAIEKAGVIFQTGYFNRGRGDVRFVRDAVRSGKFGKVTRLRLSNCHSGSLGGWFDTEWRWMAEPSRAGCGAFGDLGTHVLDLLLWIMQGDAVVQATGHIGVATGRYGDCDEYGEGVLQFASGAVGTVAGGWVDVANPHFLEVSGTQGHATISRGGLFVTCSNIEGADGKQAFTAVPESLPHAFDLFLQAVQGKQGLPLVGPMEAAERNAVMEAIYAGSAGKKWVKPRTTK